jgi:hypothetical protein
MKPFRLAVIASLLLLAGLVSAEQVQTLDATHYAIAAPTDVPVLELIRRNGETRETLVVPSTDDEAVESHAKLLWDSSTSTLFVVWQRSVEGANEIRLAWLNPDGMWSEPITVAGASSLNRVSLQVALTRAASLGAELDVTLIHMVWWSLGSKPEAEYALVAFEAGANVSSLVASLDTLSEDLRTLSTGPEAEDTGEAIHPPLAMSKVESAVDVVYGDVDSTGVTRVRLEPVRIAGNARAWRPLGRTGDRTGRTGFISNNSAPVGAFISKGRIVLYTPDEEFRFVVYENGEWSPVRMIQLDETLTGDQVLYELRRTVDDLAPVQPKPRQEEEQ